MRAIFATLATLPALALAAIQITGPDSSDYWVQNTSKTITWSYTSGDPSPISILVVNGDVNILNGAFSIDEYVDVSLESFTITNITLKTGTGYNVQFVNPANPSEVYATGPQFEVRPAGTPPASGGNSGSGSSSSLSGSGSGNGSPSSTSSSAGPSGSTGSNTGGAFTTSPNLFFGLTACGFIAVASLFA